MFQFIDFVKLQRGFIKSYNANHPITLTRNYLDILLFIADNGSSTVTELSKKLLYTNYNQTLRIIQEMTRKGLILVFNATKAKKGNANLIFVGGEGNKVLKEFAKRERLLKQENGIINQNCFCGRKITTFGIDIEAN